jgi:hypothetical protein
MICMTTEPFLLVQDRFADWTRHPVDDQPQRVPACVRVDRAYHLNHDGGVR